jgi:hypothetical protein
VKPEPTRVLEAMAGRWMTELAPHVEPAYRRASLTVEALLLLCAREEWERAAARRVEENRALRALFADAAAEIGDAALGSRLEASAGAEEPSLRVDDLERANQELRRLLIELHAYVETWEAPAARRLEAAIWRELRLSTERRRLALGPY